MKKKIIIMYGMMVLATVLAVNGQGISYYLAENVAVMSPKHYLTIITAVSILLFLVTPVMVYKHNMKNEQKSFAVTVVINFIISIPISIWSFFVLVMWWG